MAAHWPAPPGFLTPTGWRQHVELGEWVRRRYVDLLKFLPAEFEPNKMHIRSTDFSRTMRSARANLFGMYRAGADSLKLDVKPKVEDFEGVPPQSCDRLGQLRKLLQTTPEYLKLDQDHQVGRLCMC